MSYVKRKIYAYVWVYVEIQMKGSTAKCLNKLKINEPLLELEQLIFQYQALILSHFMLPHWATKFFKEKSLQNYNFPKKFKKIKKSSEQIKPKLNVSLRDLSVNTTLRKKAKDIQVGYNLKVKRGKINTT